MENLDDRRAGHRNVIDIAELLATPSQQLFALLDEVLLRVPVLVYLSVIHPAYIYEHVQVAVLQISTKTFRSTFFWF